MSQLPIGDPHETIHLGDHTAVIVPIDEYLRLREAQVENEQVLAHRRFLERAATGDPAPAMTTQQVRDLLKLDQV
jgi:hypothetical protein